MGRTYCQSRKSYTRDINLCQLIRNALRVTEIDRSGIFFTIEISNDFNSPPDQKNNNVHYFLRRSVQKFFMDTFINITSWHRNYI